MKIGCIVLAAGHSKRFGADDKLLCTLGDKPLARWILDTLPTELFSNRVAVITSEQVKALCEEAHFPFVQYEGGVLSDSIRVGLNHLPSELDGYLFVNADRPFLRRETLISMVQVFNKAPNSVVRLFWQDTPSNPILFPSCARADLLALEGDRGGSAVLKSGKYKIEKVYARYETETWDADSPEALEKMRDELSQRGQDFVYD